MKTLSQIQINKNFSPHLSGEEKLVSVGVFKKVPSISWLLLSKGFAWLLTQRFFVGVTDQRLIILPDSSRRTQISLGEVAIFANFDEVSLSNDPLKNIILTIDKTFKGEPLNLRFDGSMIVKGFDQFDFIAAVKHAQTAV
jgi:hypothetical protein